MIANKIFRMVLAMFLTFTTLIMLPGAQFVGDPFGPNVLTKRTSSAEVSTETISAAYHYVLVERDLGQVFTIPPVHSVSSASTTVTTVPVFSGSGVFGITATPTLTETASVACSAVYHNPGQGLGLRPCFSRATTISVPHIYGSSGMVSARMVTTTRVSSITTTRTVTLVLSEVRPSSASSQALETVTALCVWADQVILTPCTTVVAASSKPTSAAAANPLVAVAGVYFLGALAVGALLG